MNWASNSSRNQPEQKKASSEEMFACEICYKAYNQDNTQPHVLPCGHTFCSSCCRNFRNICPNCRERFQDSQVKKNYFIFNLLDSQKRFPTLEAKEANSEKCSVHKREIDRFCKSCRKLMCSVCHCQHLGSTDIISDVNLRDEVGRITESLMAAKVKKKIIEEKIAAVFQEGLERAERNEGSAQLRAQESQEREIQRIESRKNKLIQEAEEVARQKIEAIQEEKEKTIQKANLIAEEEMKTNEMNYKNCLERFKSNKVDLIQRINTTNEEFLEKLKVLPDGKIRDLEKLQTNTLDQCMVLYESWETSMPEFEKIHLFDEDSIQTQFTRSFRGGSRGGYRGGFSGRGSYRGSQEGRGSFRGGDRGSRRGDDRGSRRGDDRDSFRGGDRGSFQGDRENQVSQYSARYGSQQDSSDEVKTTRYGTRQRE